MSDQNKHIDRIFQESFKHFESQPSPEVWERIQHKMQPKRRAIVPFWFKTAAVAAALILAFLLGNWMQPLSSTENSSVSNFNPKDAQIETKIDFDSYFDETNQLLDQLVQQTAAILSNSLTQSNSNSSLSIASANIQQNNTVASAEPTNTEIAEVNENVANSNPFLNQSNPFVNLFQADDDISTPESESTPNSLATLEEVDQNRRQFDALLDESELSESTSGASKWFLKPVISPIFNAANNASSALGQDLASNSSNGDLGFSYGMHVGFKLNNRWSIRTGVNQVNTSYTTENVIYAPAASAFMPSGTSSIYGIYGENFFNNNLSTQAGRVFSQEGSLSQQMNFIEVPLELEYAILEGKFGVSLTGGASTLLLTDNGLIMNTADGGLNIGEAQNLNQTSFSTNLGLGIQYQLSRKLKFNVEPAFKYQINTFESNEFSFDPYFFAVYSGLQFQF